MQELGKALRFVLHLGFSMALPLLLCIWGGYKLDQRYNTGYLFLILGILLGIAFAFYNLIQAAKSIDKW